MSGIDNFDTWLRKHSQYAFTRPSTRCLKYSAQEYQRSLSPQAFTRTSTKKKEIKNPEDPILFARDHGDLQKYLVFKSIKLTATYIKVERGFLLHYQFKHARNLGKAVLDQNGISWKHKSGKAQLVCIRSFFSKYFDIASLALDNQSKLKAISKGVHSK